MLQDTSDLSATGFLQQTDPPKIRVVVRKRPLNNKASSGPHHVTLLQAQPGSVCDLIKDFTRLISSPSAEVALDAEFYETATVLTCAATHKSEYTLHGACPSGTAPHAA